MDLSLCLTNSQHITLPRPKTERSPRSLFTKRQKFESTYSCHSARKRVHPNPRFTERSFTQDYFLHVITDSPITPEEALKRLKFEMTQTEVNEIENYPEIYYVGSITNKVSKGEQSYDDLYHYYTIVIHDQIAFRYEIQKKLIKDDYGTFVSCFDHKEKRQVVLQILTNTPEMKIWSEAQIERQNLIDNPESNHIVKHLSHFEFRNHVIFEYEDFGRNISDYARTFHFWSSPHKPLDFPPIEVDSIRSIVRPVIAGIRYLHSKNMICGNIMSSTIFEKAKNLRLVNYGYDPNKQALRYRSPEAIMGLPVDLSSDMFSFGLLLIELINGRPMFNGRTDNEQFALYVDFLGSPPRELMRRSSRSRELAIPKSGNVKIDRRDMNYRIQNPIHVPGGTHIKLAAIDSRRSEEEEFYDMVKRCLDWWPQKRITAEEAYRHGFFNHSSPQPKNKTKSSNRLPSLRT